MSGTTTNFALRYPGSGDAVFPHIDIQNLASDVDGALNSHTGYGAGAIATAAGSATTTSTSYVDMPATSSVTVTKKSASTRLKVTMSVSAYLSGSGGTLGFGIKAGGVDYDMLKINYATSPNELLVHKPGPIGVKYVSGLAAGSQTVQGRWKVLAGTGTGNLDSGDWVTIDVQEVE
jgi:hypothetical protein